MTGDRKVTYVRGIEDEHRTQPAQQPGTQPPGRAAQDGLVFKALADDGRRLLLDALFARDGQSLTALCAALPSMTRFGVMKHLTVLAQAGLVVTHREGRSKLHYLNAVPIQEIADRWIGKYATATTTTLTELRRHLEAGPA